MQEILKFAAYLTLAFSLAPLFGFADWRLAITDNFRHVVAFASVAIALALLVYSGPDVRAAVASAFVAAIVAGAPVAQAAAKRGHAVAAGAAATEAVASDKALRFASYNILITNDDVASNVSKIADDGVEVAVLVETTRKWADALKSEGWHVEHHNGRVVGGITIASKYPLSKSEIVDLGMGQTGLAVRLETPKGRMSVLGVHLLSPMGADRLAARDEGLRRLAEITAGPSAFSALPYVIAGDFNATPWSEAFLSFLKRGGVSSTHTIAATWPAFMPLVGLPIDHVLGGSGAVVKIAGVGVPIGSDHRPVYVDVVLPVGSAAKMAVPNPVPSGSIPGAAAVAKEKFM